MASSYTTNYQLNQWSAADQVLRTEFNADNSKVDAALKTNADAIAAETAARTAALGQKADQSALSSLVQTVSGHTAALTQLGNCQLYHTTYVGTGTADFAAPSSLTFPHKPYVLFVGGGSEQFIALRGMGAALGIRGGGLHSNVKPTWGDRGVTWYSNASNNAPASQCNSAGVTYQAVALLDMTE